MYRNSRVLNSEIATWHSPHPTPSAPFPHSAGPYSFQTLARYNQAHCLSRLKRGPEALAVLDALLSEDPRNTLAQTLNEILMATA